VGALNFTSVNRSISVRGEDENEEGEAEEEDEAEPSGPPELATLNTASLSNLAAALGRDGLKLAMCLNVPTSTLIHIQFQGLDDGWDVNAIITNMLFYWKLMRRTAKDRDKVGHFLSPPSSSD